MLRRHKKKRLKQVPKSKSICLSVTFVRLTYWKVEANVDTARKIREKNL